MADTPLWTAEELVAATGGKLTRPITQLIKDVSIDTRTLAIGDVYVAIKGDVYDGHDFVAKAQELGAGVCLVSRATSLQEQAGPLLMVDDPLQALERLGRAARARSQAAIVAVTGSVGKTSSKEMLKLALSASGATHASAASFNNHWGVPLTLARMPRDTAYGVFEIGMNHIGEIKELVAMVRPHVALITNVAPVHVGNFRDIDEIAVAKAEIFSGLEPGGAALLNRDNEFFDQLAQLAKAQNISRIISFGENPEAQARLQRLVLHESCSCITADILGEELIYKLGMAGEHMALNSVAVLAAVSLLGADLARAGLALAVAQAPKGRGVQLKFAIANGEIRLIDESYNANPLSMAAALALLGQVKLTPHGRRIAVLGDMRELGHHGPKLHADLAPLLEQHKVDRVYAAGTEMAHLWALVPAEKRGAYAEQSTGLEEHLLGDLRAGDVVMIKGSNGSRMGILSEAIARHFVLKHEDR